MVVDREQTTRRCSGGTEGRRELTTYLSRRVMHRTPDPRQTALTGDADWTSSVPLGQIPAALGELEASAEIGVPKECAREPGRRSELPGVR